MRSCMLDLETYGVVPGCPILSIGAQIFDDVNGTLGESFYIAMDSDQSVWGLKSEPQTVLWWEQRSEEAREVLFDPSRVSLRDGLALFCLWLREQDDCLIWGNGADFDPPILVKALHMLGYETPWRPYSVRCYRTIKNLRPDIKMRSPVVAHHALADATAQAVHLMDIREQTTLTFS